MVEPEGLKIYIYIFTYDTDFLTWIIVLLTFFVTLVSNLSLTWALTKEMGCLHDSQVVMRCNGPTVTS